MNRFLNNNLPWKIVSLILATILWVFVINTQNPVLTKELYNLPVTLKGVQGLEEKGFVLQNEAELKEMNIKVVIRGQRLEMEELMSNPSNLKLKLDLTPFVNVLTDQDPESIEKPIAIEVDGELGNLKIESIEPRTVSGVFERETSIIKDIYTNIEGANSNNYIAQEPILKPTKVQITGPKSSVNRIDKAVVDVNVNNFSEDVLTYKLPIKLLDLEGEEVVGVRANPSEVEVILPIGKKKEVPLEAQFKGELPSGYVQSNTIITPEQIVIVGKSTVVDNIQSIKLEPIGLDNMIQSDTFQVEPVLPKGVERIDSNDIAVTIEIQKEIAYEYTIDTTQLKLDVIGLPKNYEMYITQPTVSVSLLGTPENLLGFNAKDVQATLNLRLLGNITPGEYVVPLSIAIPPNLKLLTGENTPPLTIAIQVVDPEETFEEENEEGTTSDAGKGNEEEDKDKDKNKENNGN